jgi:phosphatidylinositol-3-phosphatase
VTVQAKRGLLGLVPATVGLALLAAASPVSAGSGRGDGGHDARATLGAGKINHIVVIDLENEDFATTFGDASPARFLNDVLVHQGQLIDHYYATSHVSQGNYISQVSGQASTAKQNSDCINLASLTTPPVTGEFTDVTPATPTAAGQVIGDGCVFPAAIATIGDQLDAKYGDGHRGSRYVYPWRVYAEDMGNIPNRDYGTPDPFGGTDCAHPPIGGADNSNSAVADDGYATRHNPFMYFHSIIDTTGRCDQRVVPLGTVTVGDGAQPDSFSGHLAEDLRHKKTTPAFSFVIPDLCNDGHDAVCKPAQPGATTTDVEGGNAGGLAAADLWLKHWVPLLMRSPAYRSGEMLIVITLDEASFSSPTSYLACCNQQPGPNQAGNPGYSPILGLFGLQTPPTATGVYPGGGQIGAVLLNSKYIVAGSHNTTGTYNHYSALRSYEDLLGIDTGGTDGHGHLGYAAAPGLTPFSADVFNR